MLFHLLPGGFELPVFLLLQQLPGVLEGIFEKAGSLFLLPVAMLADAFSSGELG